jgi:hypothetical protein
MSGVLVLLLNGLMTGWTDSGNEGAILGTPPGRAFFFLSRRDRHDCPYPAPAERRGDGGLFAASGIARESADHDDDAIGNGHVIHAGRYDAAGHDPS